MYRMLLLSALLLPAPLLAQSGKHHPAKADAAKPAQPRVLETPVLPADDSLATPTTSPAPTEPASTGVVSVFTLDTPIRVLIADPGAKAVLDRDMPGLSEDENLAKFESMSLRQFQPMTGGQLTNALLAKVGADLNALGATMPLATPAPAAKVGRRNTIGR